MGYNNDRLFIKMMFIETFHSNYKSIWLDTEHLVMEYNIREISILILVKLPVTQ